MSDQELIRRQFGAHAEKYATSPVHAGGDSLKRLVALARPEPHWRVLDVATGAGHAALAFAPHVREVVACDITGEMLDQARQLAEKRGVLNLRTQAGDAMALPFPERSFDLVTSRIAPHHFTSIAQFASEAARVLAAGGRLAIADNISPEEPEAAALYNAFEKARDPSHARALPVSEWQQIIAGAGLELVACEQLVKEIAFRPWAERLGARPPVVAALRETLMSGPEGLLAFLQPRATASDLVFHLREAVLVAVKA